MKRALGVVGCAASICALAAAPAMAGTAGGNGAHKSGLAPAPQNSDVSNCRSNAGTGSNGPNGWAILNKTGQPVTGVVSTFQGGVHLTGAAPGSYDIYVGKVGEKSCQPVGNLDVNGDGVGNGHIPSGTYASYTGSNGAYYVVITPHMSTSEKYASSPVNEL